MEAQLGDGVEAFNELEEFALALVDGEGLFGEGGLADVLRGRSLVEAALGVRGEGRKGLTLEVGREVGVEFGECRGDPVEIGTYVGRFPPKLSTGDGKVLVVDVRHGTLVVTQDDEQDVTDKALVSTWATRAATAQAGRFCAEIAAEYPNLWPETIRALVVHSAEWTEAMRGHLAQAGGKTARAQWVRRYGFGVPNLGRALRSASNAVTLVVQDSIRPFEDGKMREIHFHDLPWPREALAALGDAAVRVRVTLSYFVEPNPARRGWQTKHRYQSHGLRFEVKGPTESLDEFRKRLNRSALKKEEKRPSSGADSHLWYLGSVARDRGSIHSDILASFAADIAERGTLAVYPVTGWWKELKTRDRSEHGARYALVVTIETDEVDAELWTPIATQVGVAPEIAI